MRPLSPNDLNPAVANVQYAVRGELAIKAEAFRTQLESKDHGLPFNRVINSNIGNPQQKGLDQPPITFSRQVRLSRILSFRHAHPAHRHPHCACFYARSRDIMTD